MEQLSLFEAQSVDLVIPKDVISPLESNKGLKTKEFRKIQERWKKYVIAVQESHNCSWFKARDLLVKHRENQEPIKVGASIE